MGMIKNILERSYFGKLFRKDRFLFALAFSFILLSLLANFIKLETSPFFVWNMYSERYYPRQDYEIIEVRYNDNQVLNIKHTWQSPQQLFLTEPLNNYLSFIKNGGSDPARNYLENHWAVKHPAFKEMVTHLYNSPADYRAFPAWYKNYLSAIEKDSVRNIFVLNKKLQFAEDGRITCLSTDTLLFIP
jgi:hypothetical protein